jgi:hypothetical protein
MNTYNQLADKQSLDKTTAALRANGIDVVVTATGAEAKNVVLAMIPHGAEVMTMTSTTADQIGLSSAINESKDIDAIKPKLFSMDRKTQGQEMQKLGAAPEWSVGSVHAVTQNGEVIVASVTGSQLPGYAYGSAHVIWVVGTQKIVENMSEGMRRLSEYVLPLESERAKKAYGVPGSSINKTLVFHKEIVPHRITLIFVQEKLGF